MELVNFWHSIFRSKYWVSVVLHGTLPLPVVVAGIEEKREQYALVLLPTREEIRRL